MSTSFPRVTPLRLGDGYYIETWESYDTWEMHVRIVRQWGHTWYLDELDLNLHEVAYRMHPMEYQRLLYEFMARG